MYTWTLLPVSSRDGDGRDGDKVQTRPHRYCAVQNKVQAVTRDWEAAAPS